MNKTNKVSCVLVNWNYGMFLRECLDSLVNQTVIPDKIILSDDNSTDSSKQIFEEYIERYPDLFIKSYNDTRLGTIPNENKGALLVETPYFFFMDADDTLDLTYVEKCLRIFETRDDKCVIVYSDMMRFGNWSGVWAVIDWDSEALRQGNYINGHSMMLAQAFRDIGGLRDTGGFEDHQMWVDFLDLNRDYYGVHIPEALVNYRRHNYGHRTNKTDIETRQDMIS